MGVSKVVIGDEVRLDLTADTVEPAALKAGYTAHNAAGDEIVGTMPAISLKDVYPVGAIYMSVVATNPSTLFGFGIWEQIKDVFLLAAGDTYAGGSVGGEATHTLTNSEMPSHDHAIWHPNESAGNNSAQIGYPSVASKSTYYAVGSNTGDVGGGQAHNNMPPYLAVYVWKRTA